TGRHGRTSAAGRLRPLGAPAAEPDARRGTTRRVCRRGAAVVGAGICTGDGGRDLVYLVGPLSPDIKRHSTREIVMPQLSHNFESWQQALQASFYKAFGDIVDILPHIV